MNINPERLGQALQKGLAPVYLVAGAEPLLVQESRDRIIHAAKAQGYLDRDVYQVDRYFDWDVITAGAMAQSLFSSRKITDIRLPTGKPGKEGSKFLIAQTQAADPDALLLVSCDAWDAASRKSKWAAEISRAGVVIEIWPVKPQELPRWIEARLRAAGLQAERDAVRLLADLVEGNLLAAQQEIDKLALLGSGESVTAELIGRAVGNSSRFDTFRLGECLLSGNASDSLRVAAGLQRTGVAIQAVAGSLYYQLNQLAAVSAALRRGENEGRVFARLRVFKSQQPLYRQASRRLPESRIDQVFQLMALLDRQSKGRAPGDAWQTLDQILLLCTDAAAVHNRTSKM